MDFEISIDINAPRERVWAVLSDVERWPEWTASMTSVHYVSGDSLAEGSRVRIRQPRLPAVVWEVTAVEPGQSFSWMARGAGFSNLAVHRVTSESPGGVTVSLGIRLRGPMALPIGILTARLTRRYLQMEADGLKRRAETSAKAPSEGEKA